MSEWFKEHDWKSCVGGSSPQVQILFSAPKKSYQLIRLFLSIAKAMVYHQTAGLDIITQGAYHQP